MSWFVTFEGLDGSGKTTQIGLLRAFLDREGHPAFITREPGGTALGEQLRKLVLPTSAAATTPTAEALLMSAARAQLVAKEIGPRLARGQPVVCDRYADSTLAYQGYGRGLDLQALRSITHFATGGLSPDLTFLLDLELDESVRRRRGLQALGTMQAARGAHGHHLDNAERTSAEREESANIDGGSGNPNFSEANFFDHIDVHFRRRVRDGYLELAAMEPRRWLVLDASKSVDEVQLRVRAAVSLLWK